MKKDRKILFLLSLLAAAVLLTSCGGQAQPPADDFSRSRGSPGESAASEAPPQSNTSGTEFEEGELPEDFPEAFPVHPEARVGSAVDGQEENHFRVFLAFSMDLDQVLAYYRQELLVKGWTVESEETTSLGTELKITNLEYEAKLDFITSDMGVVLDLAIDPLGEAAELPEIAEGIGESSELGEVGGDFPADFPVPLEASPIPLSDKLREEGYQLAFAYPQIPEMALVQISTALMGAGWEIGEYEIDVATHVFLVPFTDPGGSFEGYALLTDNPDVIGIDLAGGSLIALHPGSR